MIIPDHMEISSERIAEKNVKQNMENSSSVKYEKEIKMIPSQHVFSVCQCSSEQNGSLLPSIDLNMKASCDSDHHDHFIRARMTHLAGAFSARAQLFLSKLQRPPTPTQSSTSSFNSSNGVSLQSASNNKLKKIQSLQSSEKSSNHCISCAKVLDPQSRAYLWWLVAVSLCFVYNCWAIPLRTSFPKPTLTVWDSSFKPESVPGMSSVSHTTISQNISTSHPQNIINEVEPHSKLLKIDSHIQMLKSPSTSPMPKYHKKINSSEYIILNSVAYLKSTSWLFDTNDLSKSSFRTKFSSDKGSHSQFSSTSPHPLPDSVTITPGISSTPFYDPLLKKTMENSSESSVHNLLTPTWLTLDSLADIIYLLDVLLIQPRVSFLSESGIWAGEISTTLHSYTRRKRSKLDIIALLPLDTIFYFLNNGKDYAYLRVPRLLKAGTFWEMCERLDVTLASPHAVRIARTVASMLYLVHLHACAYYLFSAWEGIASNGWVFSGRGNAYIRCFYFATKTATSIGKNPKPVNEAEYLFMTWSWLSGVFVFALLIGQIRDIVATASKSRSEFQRLLDETIHYMRRIHLPEDTQRRVTQWLTHTWDYQQVLDEQEVLDWLPSKLRGDVALDVHEGSLSKVHLFRHCGQQLLRQLVLKLRPVLYLPGDFICRKGEVGKEMYIIKAGIVEVVGSRKPSADGDGVYEVLATLTEGSVFGEISLLDIGGGNKRTADVRSKGFSTLFVLSKADLKEALEHHPEAKQILKEKASQLMRENADREQKTEREGPREEDAVIIKQDSNKQPMPKLIDTVIQAVGTKSRTAQLLMYGSRALNLEVEKLKTANSENHTIEDEMYMKITTQKDTEVGSHMVKSDNCGKNQVQDFTNSKYDPYFQNSSHSTRNLTSSTSMYNNDHVSSISNGMHKYRTKKFGSKNVFECDVTVHQRMG